jgi:hypothetical protein
VLPEDMDAAVLALSNATGADPDDIRMAVDEMKVSAAERKSWFAQLTAAEQDEAALSAVRTAVEQVRAERDAARHSDAELTARVDELAELHLTADGGVRSGEAELAARSAGVLDRYPSPSRSLEQQVDKDDYTDDSDTIREIERGKAEAEEIAARHAEFFTPEQISAREVARRRALDLARSKGSRTGDNRAARGIDSSGNQAIRP